ncbi:hypothetical protein ENSA5_67580 [Enhygromyxa salina]|uniref:Uncharacterized protein n=1 Tax=Enhygromyxa salina TaxID=215803 RepID=A0A2S9XBG3_9BACT|nr:hypothetical protein ENSA5_67580 [Enhygromyxa salina]
MGIGPKRLRLLQLGLRIPQLGARCQVQAEAAAGRRYIVRACASVTTTP